MDEILYAKHKEDVGKYGRVGDYIFKITGIKMGFGNETGHYPTHFITKDLWGKVVCEEVEKIEEDILDLIKVGDIIKFEENGVIAYFGMESETITINYNDIKDAIRKREVKLLQIIPKGEIEDRGYVLGE